MRDLVALFVEAGCHDVRSYIQSGNVVYGARAPLARRIPELIRAGIEQRFGYDIPVVTRTAKELWQVAHAHPFAKQGVDPKALHVAFLVERPSTAAVKALDPNRSPGDEFRVQSREIYLHCPNGIARTRLTNAWFGAQLSTTSTMRNWRTVQKLLELTDGA